MQHVLSAFQVQHVSPGRTGLRVFWPWPEHQRWRAGLQDARLCPLHQGCVLEPAGTVFAVIMLYNPIPEFTKPCVDTRPRQVFHPMIDGDIFLAEAATETCPRVFQLCRSGNLLLYQHGHFTPMCVFASFFSSSLNTAFTTESCSLSRGACFLKR